MRLLLDRFSLLTLAGAACAPVTLAGVMSWVMTCLLIWPAPAAGAPTAAEQTRIEAKILTIRAALKKDPDDPDLVFQLARQLSLLERTAEAARQYARILAVYPGNPDYLLGQGQNFLWGKQAQRAIAPLQRAMRIAPTYQDVQRTLAQAFIATSRAAEARALYLQALRRFGRPVWAQRGLAGLDIADAAAAPAGTAAVTAASAMPGARAPVADLPRPAEAVPVPAAAAPLLAATAPTGSATTQASTMLVPAPPLVEQTTQPLKRSLETGFGRETLSTGTPDWRDAYLQFNQQLEGRRSWLGRVTAASRFGIADTALLASGFTPLTDKTALNVEALVSPTNRVLARHTLHTQISHSLPAGWGVQAGWKRLAYNTASIDALDITVERYFGPFRAAWTISPSRSSTAGDAVGQRVQMGYFYGDTSSVQVLFAAGREVDKPSAAGAIVATDVRSTALFGHHALGPEWGLVYGAGRTQQGTTSRESLNVGLRWRF